MFLLLIVVFVVTQSGDLITKSQVLNTFDDIEVCEAEADRVRKAMQESYPEASDYIITCKENEKSRRGV